MARRRDARHHYARSPRWGEGGGGQSSKCTRLCCRGRPETTHRPVDGDGLRIFITFLLLLLLVLLLLLGHLSSHPLRFAACFLPVSSSWISDFGLSKMVSIAPESSEDTYQVCVARTSDFSAERLRGAFAPRSFGSSSPFTGVRDSHHVHRWALKTREPRNRSDLCIGGARNHRGVWLSQAGCLYHMCVEVHVPSAPLSVTLRIGRVHTTALVPESTGSQHPFPCTSPVCRWRKLQSDDGRSRIVPVHGARSRAARTLQHESRHLLLGHSQLGDVGDRETLCGSERVYFHQGDFSPGSFVGSVKVGAFGYCGTGLFVESTGWPRWKPAFRHGEEGRAEPPHVPPSNRTAVCAPGRDHFLMFGCRTEGYCRCRRITRVFCVPPAWVRHCKHDL